VKGCVRRALVVKDGLCTCIDPSVLLYVDTYKEEGQGIVSQREASGLGPVYRDDCNVIG